MSDRIQLGSLLQAYPAANLRYQIVADAGSSYVYSGTNKYTFRLASMYTDVAAPHLARLQKTQLASVVVDESTFTLTVGTHYDIIFSWDNAQVNESLYALYAWFLDRTADNGVTYYILASLTTTPMSYTDNGTAWNTQSGGVPGYSSAEFTAFYDYVVNQFDSKGQQIVSLIKAQIPGFAGVYYGFRSVGTRDIAFPAAMVEAVSQRPYMVTTGKYRLVMQYHIYFYVVENESDSLVMLQTHCAEALIELFSNRFYKTNGTFWQYSEIEAVDLSGRFINAKANLESRYMRAGLLRLQIIDEAIVK